MPGFLEPIWETVFRVATWSALIFGTLSIGSAFVSAWVGWEITDATQKDADHKIKAADERIAEFNTRAKEAELQLEMLRDRMRPRRIKAAEFLKILDGKPKAPVEILFVRDDPDCFQLSMQIRDFLKQAKWEVKEPRAIESADMTPRLAQYTSTMGVGGQPHGVTVVLRATSQADFDRENKGRPFDLESLDTPLKALSTALGDSLGGIATGISYETGLPDALLVVVGPKHNLN
jgi:hypothetical protein